MIEATPTPLVAKIREVRDNIPSVSPGNTKAREDLLKEARSLVKTLERDDDIIERIGFQIWEPITIRIGVDIGLFKILRRSDVPNSTQELAE
ncbi:MAG: hypothetical protein M1820_009162 [Bogoriella megaspora]|nr:MAG: hypothetical protein M1820_009162 [Bogoriella megaspora]